MAVSFTKYTSYDQYVHSEIIDLNNTGKVMLALVTSSYTFSAAHTVWGDVSANEVATGDGYTTGGVALASLSVNSTRFDSADPSWTGLTKVFRYGVLYINETVNGIVKPLIGCILFDTTPANITMTGGTFTCQVDSDGWITF